ncbi:kelch repeat and BTB domain-containing protein 2-like [Drosophila novamexicana]|uniref:kelch repeat and BTB domain-containing protein 2-like n=1 Tax=Drosophila novamexicana TaxID=47314 RepID=UPI0011E591C4|nr:kelch repeat and BTB domain-containing protein 2-like [Drosophila novamexicana]
MSKWLVDTSKNLSNDSSFTDCVIIVGATTFKCHKLILSYASEFFKRMFLGDFKEALSGRIYLEDISATTFKIFRDYIYTYDKNNLNECTTQTIIDLFVCGNRWLVPSIIEECLNILIERAKSMKVEDLVDLFELGHSFDSKSLIKEVSAVLTAKHYKYLFCDKVLQLSYHAFSEYISVTAKLKTEIERYKMIAKYLELNGFLDESTMASEAVDKKSEDFENNNNSLKKDETNEGQMEIIDAETEKPNCQRHQETYVQDLLGSINYTKMSGDEFYEGPGKSKFLTQEAKYEILYKIQSRRISRLNVLLNQYRAM